MLENVIEVEAKGVYESSNKNNQTALLLFDLASAFPSIARAFIWIALRAIAVHRSKRYI